MNDAVVTDRGIAADRDVGVHNRARTDGCPFFDDREWTDGRIGGNACTGTDECRRMHTRRGPVASREEADRLGEREVRILRPQHRAGGSFGVLTQDHGGRASALQRSGIFAVGEEGDVAGLGLVDAGDTLDDEVAVTFEAALEPGGKIGELQGPQYTFRHRDSGAAGCGAETLRSPARTARLRGSGAGYGAPRATEPGCGAEPHVIT